MQDRGSEVISIEISFEKECSVNAVASLSVSNTCVAIVRDQRALFQLSSGVCTMNGLRRHYGAITIARGVDLCKNVRGSKLHSLLVK